MLSRNDYWRYREPSAMRALNNVRRVKVSVDAGKVTKSGTRREVTAKVSNRGSAVAAMVRLSLLDERSGERVLPTLYSDNYVWLLPGESRTFTLSWPAESLPSGRPPCGWRGTTSSRPWHGRNRRRGPERSGPRPQHDVGRAFPVSAETAQPRRGTSETAPPREIPTVSAHAVSGRSSRSPGSLPIIG